jgi:glyoxylase-like metal-dependent hydrolase (beta-lactamase superfamily II)
MSGGPWTDRLASGGGDAGGPQKDTGSARSSSWMSWNGVSLAVEPSDDGPPEHAGGDVLRDRGGRRSAVPGGARGALCSKHAMTDPPLLSALGIHRVAIPVPFMEAAGPVNVYAIEEDGGGFALFDAGLGTSGSEAVLRAGLARAGLSLRDARRVIVSHGHSDHFGGAELVRAESGALIYLHPADLAKTQAPGTLSPDVRREVEAYLPRLGLDDAAIRLLLEAYRKTGALARPIADAQPLGEGDVLRFARFGARVLHVPGHTPGLIVLHDEAHRLLFSADHILARIAPSPFLELGPQGARHKLRSLVSYLASARRTYELDVDWVLPGHGAPFQGHRAVLDALFTHQERRQQALLARLEDRPAGALELVRDVFPPSSPQQAYVALSDVLGNLEVLEDEGLVVREETDGRYRWRST